MAKRLNTLLRHGDLPREEDGAIGFWRLNDDLRNKFEFSQYWSDDVWKSKMAGGGGNKKIFRYCTDPSGQEILYLRALQGHSERNPIDPTLQDYMFIPNNFFVKSIPPNTENSMQYGYDEKDQQHEQWDQAWDQLQHEQQMTWTRTITCSSQSTTSTPMTTFSQTLAWCTWYTELAHSAHFRAPVHVVSHLIDSTSESCHKHLHSHPWAHLFYFDLSFPVFFFSFHLLHCELYSELDNLIAMESLCYSANKGSDDAYDVSTSLTGYEPNFMSFSELNDSSGSFSYIIPSSDQDMDDVTLGKLLTEAHRGQADYC